ncbi:hypothetical protein OY671_008674, partial [Metschnikowia pulcherrima]
MASASFSAFSAISSIFGSVPAAHAQAVAPASAAPASTIAAQAAPASAPAAATPSPSAVAGALDRAFGQMAGNQQGGSLSSSSQLSLIMGSLTISPSSVSMMTSFTRILVVSAISRQASGLQQSPPNQVSIGLSSFSSS